MFRLASSLSCVLLLCGAATAQQPYFVLPSTQPYSRVAAPWAGGMIRPSGQCLPPNCANGQCITACSPGICSPNGCDATSAGCSSGQCGCSPSICSPNGCDASSTACNSGQCGCSLYLSRGCLAQPCLIQPVPTLPYSNPAYRPLSCDAYGVPQGYYSNPSTSTGGPFYGTSYQDSQLRDRSTSYPSAIQPLTGSDKYSVPLSSYDWTPGNTVDVGVLR